MTGTLDTSRRTFLKSSAVAGGGLLIGFSLPLAARLAEAAAPAAAINAYLRIAPDNRITVLCGLSEMGQGVLTAIPMLVAEELDADWSRVAVEQAPVDQAFVNPAFGIQATGGSTAVRGHWLPMRKAGATARAMLVAAAAKRWRTSAEGLRTAGGFVLHPDGRRLAYGTLATAAARETPPADPPLKAIDVFRLLGRDAPRLDTAQKVDGSARFGLDVRLPGMLTAIMARAPVPGGRVVSVDDSRARAVPGVRQVLRIDSGVAVLADGFWPARLGRDELQIQWDDGPLAGLSSEAIRRALDEAAARGGPVARSDGDAAGAAARMMEATYEAPYLAHACMEPMNCTAWVRGDEVEIWAGTQAQGPSQGILAQVAAVAPAKVKVNTLFLGGGFGRRFAPDFTVDATRLSQLAGKPVKLVYTREDDMRAYYYRPVALARFRGGVDGAGRLAVLKASVAGPSIMAGSGFMKLPADGVDRFAVEGIADLPYAIPNLRVEYARVEPGVQVWFWRSVGHSQNIFFIESFIDELAAAAGRDPFEFRHAHLGSAPRHRAVLALAAEKAQWGKALAPGRFRGIAVAASFGSYVAEVAEVSVAEDGRPRVHRVICAVDCGMTVNPAIIRRQMESAIAYGLTAALHGRISFEDGRVAQSNFHDYPMLRMNEMPAVEVHILTSRADPGGVGEPGLPPIAPAVANAIYAATGKRLRRLPFDPAELRRT